MSTIVWNHTSHNEDITIKYTTLTIRVFNINTPCVLMERYIHTVYIDIYAYCIHPHICIVYVHTYCICIYIFNIYVYVCVCTFFFYFTSSTYSIAVLPARMSPHEKRLRYFRALILRKRIQWDCVLIV